MIPADQVLAAMLSLPTAWLDRAESPEQRAELYRPVAEAIADFAKNDRQAALLIAQAYADTKLARAVLEGRCQDMPDGQRCDNGKTHGPFQVAVAHCPTSDLREQAKCAMRAAGGGVARCRDHSLSPTHAMFVGLGGMGRPCNWKAASDRVELYRRVLAALRRQQ